MADYAVRNMWDETAAALWWVIEHKCDGAVEIPLEAFDPFQTPPRVLKSFARHDIQALEVRSGFAGDD